MKKSVFLLIPLIILSCKKEASVSEVSGKDSMIVTEQPAQNSGFDSALDKSYRDSVINNAPATKEVLQTGVMREEKDRVIVRMADGERLPFTIGEEFTEKHDKLILKISNFNKSKITAKINTSQKDFNIRFNQIKLPMVKWMVLL